MGFMDKLKSVGRFITGGGAKVQLKVASATIGQPFVVKITADVADAPLQISGVYLQIRAEEEVRVRGETLRNRLKEVVADFAADGRLDGVTERTETCELRLQVAGPQKLAANEHAEWEISVQLPTGALPTFRGRNCDHVWRFFAGLDAPGNDPDSGWIDVEVG